MQNNLDIVKNLNPNILWNFFAELCTIPRPSKSEEGVRNWIKQFAENHSLKYKADEVGNIAVYKEKQNCNSTKTLLLQAHMDMVTENNPEVKIDFTKDPILMKQNGDYIYAQGTTLGSDNGIGLCTILTILDDKNISHPNIEALFTVDEETGMSGAMKIGHGMISADYMLNLDTEEEGSVYIGCAGGRDIVVKHKYNRSGKEKISTLKISGLRGGHSGVNIHENRVNAVKLIGQIFYDIVQKYDVYIAEIKGGNKRNAIPRDAYVKFNINDADGKALLLKEINEFSENYKLIENDIQITLEETDESLEVFDPKTSFEIINIINAIPNGVLQMSTVVDGLVQTSNNLGVISTTEDYISISTMTRSSDLFELQNVLKQILAIHVNAKANIDINNRDSFEVEYIDGGKNICVEVEPLTIGWKPEENNSLIDIFQGVHEKLFGHKAEVKAVHAGLECGVIGQFLPDCKIISFGPQIEDAHSPTEHVQISSVEKFYDLTVKVIEEIGKI